MPELSGVLYCTSDYWMHDLSDMWSTILRRVIAMLTKYIGQIVIIVYQDLAGNLSQRCIRVKAIGETTSGLRPRKAISESFQMENILAIELVNSHAS